MCKGNPAHISRDGQKVPYLIPDKSSTLIKGNMKNNIKRALLMCQLSFQGCSVCLQLLEKRPNKVPFPHLYPTLRTSVYPSTGIYHCHNLLNITIREKREQIIKNIRDLCLTCMRVLGGKRTECSCTRSRSRPFFCSRCDCHFILGIKESY